MKPVEFEGQNCVYAKDQPEYMPLPAYRDIDGSVTSCWELTDEEIEEIVKTKKIWVSQLTFHNPLHAMGLSVHKETFINKDYGKVHE